VLKWGRLLTWGSGGVFVTARLGAIVKPPADAAPSGPGSDRSHDREGVLFGESTKPRGLTGRGASKAGRRIHNPPQVNNLPHKQIGNLPHKVAA